jgi:CRISPR/Cas system-associated exonuclease Cas4 (RecB family)
MALPEGFIFSQSSLQDYVDCQRRFQLRHLLHLAWPAVEAEPYLENERKMEQGAQFHKMVRQFLVGIPESELTRTSGTDEIIQTWWSNFMSSVKSGSLGFLLESNQLHYEEITLSVPINKFRLVAKVDLLIIRPDAKVIILDWKTSQKKPRRNWLADRLQTHVYPFVLVGALPGLIGIEKIDPVRLEMVYWFANQPAEPERFSYDSRQFQEDMRFLSNLVESIDQKSELTFPLTLDVRRCLFCTYRSLCGRGVKPGNVQEMENWEEPASAEDVTIDFDQIGEIEL